MLGAGSVVGAVNKCLGVTYDTVQPFQQFSISTEILILVDISTLRKRLAVASEAVCLHYAARFNIFTHKVANRRTLDVISGVHL